VTGDSPHRPPFSCAIGMGLAYESGSSLQEQILTREVHHHLSPDPNFDFRGSTSNFCHIPSLPFKPHFTLYLTSSSHDVHSNREHASHRPRSYCKVHPGFLFCEQFGSASMPRAKRQPLGAVKSGVRKADSPPKPVVSAALRTAIDTMDHMRLRLWVKHYCETMQPLREDLEKGLLVPGKDVIRYHADSDSEDREEDEEESEESEMEESPIRPISLGDENLTPRYVKCVHCNGEFDVTKNDKGDCVWHPGL